MNVAIRAKRILSALPNYQEANDDKVCPPKSFIESLGVPVGRYRNSDAKNDAVWIFENGVAWFDNDRQMTLRFEQVAEVTLPTGKESEGLMLRTEEGQKILLPVKGQRGRFFDSMEVLRFFDRVMQDRKKGVATLNS